jgi:hypothetical protein
MPLKNSIPLRTETFVVQGAGKGADGRSFDNAWKLPKDCIYTMKPRKRKAKQIQEMNIYDLARKCAEPEGGYIDPDRMDEEVYGQGGLDGDEAPSVDESKPRKRLRKNTKAIRNKLKKET